MTALSPTRSQNRLWHDAPAFTGLALFIALTAIPLLAAAAIDSREFLNAPVWQKPLQFHLALGIYALTLAVFARFLPTPMTSRKWRIYAGIVCAAILAELLWVGGAATYGTASHFNTGNLAMAFSTASWASLLSSSPRQASSWASQSRATRIPACPPPCTYPSRLA